MVLEFPTQAERVLEAFRTTTVRTSLKRLAVKAGAVVERRDGCTIYRFDDDTSLEVKGRGRSHYVVAQLP